MNQIHCRTKPHILQIYIPGFPQNKKHQQMTSPHVCWWFIRFNKKLVPLLLSGSYFLLRFWKTLESDEHSYNRETWKKTKQKLPRLFEFTNNIHSQLPLHFNLILNLKAALRHTCNNERCHHSYSQWCSFVDKSFRQKMAQRQHKCP